MNFNQWYYLLSLKIPMKEITITFQIPHIEMFWTLVLNIRRYRKNIISFFEVWCVALPDPITLPSPSEITIILASYKTLPHLDLWLIYCLFCLSWTLYNWNYTVYNLNLHFFALYYVYSWGIIFAALVFYFMNILSFILLLMNIEIFSDYYQYKNCC